MKQAILKDIEFTLKNLQENIFRVRKNEKGEIVYTFNEGPIARSMKANTEFVYGKSIKELIGEEHAANILPYYEDAFNGKVSSYELDLGEVIFQTVLSPVLLEGNIVEVAGSSFDITEKRNQQQELKKAHEELQRINQSKDRLISIIAHDLRNPIGNLAYLLSFSMDYLNNQSFDKLMKLLIECKKSAENSFTLLENLFEWAKTQIDKNDYNPVVFPFKDIINESINIHKQMADAKNIKLSHSIEHSTLVFADPNMIKTVCRNLIVNAIKFTNPGGSCHISITMTDKYCECKVRDNGIGIETDKQSKIFDLSSSETNFGTKGERGSGLGLNLCKEFIKRNHGEIGVNSIPGQGSEFFFTIPLASKQQKEAYTKPHKETNAFDNCLLIAEDEDLNFIYLEEILKSYSLKIMRAKNGQEAIKICQSHPCVKLILMDFKMPGMFGDEACREIRKFNNDVSIIMQTTYTSEMNTEKAIAAGCNGFIQKPLKKGELFTLIDKYLGAKTK